MTEKDLDHEIENLRNKIENQYQEWSKVESFARQNKYNYQKSLDDIDWVRGVSNELRATGIYDEDYSNEFIKPRIYSAGDYLDHHEEISIGLSGAQVSGVTAEVGSGAYSLSSYLDNNQNNPRFTNIIDFHGLIPPSEKKSRLEQLLEEINPFLVTKLKSAWQVFHTSGIERDEIYPSHGMREFMSIFLQYIAPDEEIKRMSWCNKDGNPYQKYRVIFGIIGPDPYFNENSNQNLSIVKLAEKYRELYQDLNPKAHYRKEKTEDNLKIFIINCFKSVEKYTEEILYLRTLYYPKT
ncbi:MAG: hypothetical protein ACXACO_19780 [Promethearchaeota archaeon]|jgi:hypothetical protein